MRKATANRVRVGDILVSESGLEIRINKTSKKEIMVELGGFDMCISRDSFKGYFNGFYIKPKFKDYYDIL